MAKTIIVSFLFKMGLICVGGVLAFYGIGLIIEHFVGVSPVCPTYII